MDFSDISEIPEDRYGSESDILKLMDVANEDIYDEETLIYV